jgi:hypothetical protein
MAKLLMAPKPPGDQFTMNVHGQALATTTEERDIGVTVTANIKPAAQCLKAARTNQTSVTNPDPFDTDPDPAFKFVTNPDPYHCKEVV